MASPFKKRITMKLHHPNPLFEKWLTEWRDKAIETDSKMQHCFTKALNSLRKYPLPLDSGRDCKILKGFGETLCDKLEKRLLEHKRVHGDPNIIRTVNENLESKGSNKKRSATSKSNKAKEYVPIYRSGPYAILVTLYKKSLEQSYLGYLVKTDIIRQAQNLCNKSFVKPDAGSYYTAWSSMKILIEKNLVLKRHCPAQFSLTEDGLKLARKLYENNLEDTTENILNNSKSSLSHCSSNVAANFGENQTNSTRENFLLEETDISTDTHSSHVSQDDTFILAPHSFEVLLIVDNHETLGSTSNPLDDSTLSKLTDLDVKFEIRHLKVGDYVWVCQEYSTKKELVLPYIIERKRMDDFGGSIKDGRFHEQKFRLKQCGIQNLVYLIESYGNNTHVGLPLSTLYQAAVNTLVQDNFHVKFTDDLQGTIEYLASFTAILNNCYKEKTLVSCSKENLTDSSIHDDLVALMTFASFNKGASKSLNVSVQDLFVRQLLQLKGMSVEKALAIIEKYPTPQLLYRAYISNSDAVNQKLLSTLVYGKLRKKMGPVISKIIYQLYLSEKF